MSGRTHEIRLVREALAILAYEVAEASGITPARLSRIERGLEEPTPDELIRILRALGPTAIRGMKPAAELLDAVSLRVEGQR